MVFFFFNDTATTEIYTLSLHDALPILRPSRDGAGEAQRVADLLLLHHLVVAHQAGKDGKPGRIRRRPPRRPQRVDRKSTRLNSSHANISYAVFCLKKKNMTQHLSPTYP